MTELILASILIPFAGGLLTLVLPRNWIKPFSGLVAFLAGAAGIIVLVMFTMDSKTSETIDLLYIGNWLIYGIVIDKLSVLIGAALGVVGFLIVIYATGYLTPENREHPETIVMRRFYFFLLLFIGSMAGLVYSSTLLGLLIFLDQSETEIPRPVCYDRPDRQSHEASERKRAMPKPGLVSQGLSLWSLFQHQCQHPARSICNRKSHFKTTFTGEQSHL